MLMFAGDGVYVRVDVRGGGSRILAVYVEGAPESKMVHGLEYVVFHSRKRCWGAS